MEFEATEIQEFNIYLKVAKVLLHDLDNLTDQNKAAQWVQTLGPGFSMRKNQSRLMLSYIKLLVCALLRKRLVEPFTKAPGTYLDESYGNLKLADMWLTVSKSAWLARGGGGEPSPCHVEVSGDRQQYACVQRVTDGAQCYFAVSAAQKLDRWENAVKAHLPEAYKTDKKKADLPPLPELKQLPDVTLLEQKLTQKDIQKAKDVLKKIKERDSTQAELNKTPPLEARDTHVTPTRRYSIPWDKIEAGIPPTMSPGDPEYVDMSQKKYPVGYIKDFPSKGGSMEWGRRRKYLQKPYSPEMPSVHEDRRVLENITEASVLEPTFGTISDLSHISQEEPPFYNSFQDNLNDSQRKRVSFGDEKLYVPFDSMQHDLPEYRRPLSRISERSETSIPRELTIQSPSYTIFPDTSPLSHIQRSLSDTPRSFRSPGSLPWSTPATPESLAFTPRSLPHTLGSLPHTPGSLPDTPDSYYPHTPGLLPYTPRQRQDESMRRAMMQSRLDSMEGLPEYSRIFYEKMGYTNIGAYLDSIMPDSVPDRKESPVVEIPDDEAWERRLVQADLGQDSSFRWMGGGWFDMGDKDTQAQMDLQADFNRHLAEMENLIQAPENQDQFGPWLNEQQQRMEDEDGGQTAPQLFTNAMHPRDRPSRSRRRPNTLSSPTLFKRGAGRRDRDYRPSEFGLTGEEYWTPAETYFRGSIEPIFDPDEIAVERIVRFIDDSLLEDEEMDFSSVLEDSVPDWERPSWPGLRLTIPQIQRNQAHTEPLSPTIPFRKGRYTDFITTGPLPEDMLDPAQFIEKSPDRPDILRISMDQQLQKPLIPQSAVYSDFHTPVSDRETFDKEFSLSGLNTSIFDNVLENEPRGDPRTPIRRQEISDYENLWDETPLDIPIANASVDESSISDRSEIPSHIWESELHRLKSAWRKLQANESEPLTESYHQLQDESFPHSEFIETSSFAESPERHQREVVGTSPQLQNRFTQLGIYDLWEPTEFIPQSPDRPDYLQMSGSADLPQAMITSPPQAGHLQFSELPTRPTHIPTFEDLFPVFQENISAETLNLINDSSLYGPDISSRLFSTLGTSISLDGTNENIIVEDPTAPHGYRIIADTSLLQESTGPQKSLLRRRSSAPVGSSTQTYYGLDAQWDRLLQSSQVNIEDERPPFESITESSMPQIGIDDLTGISLVLDDSTLGDTMYSNHTMISATSPPQFYTSLDESYPSGPSMADFSNISSTSTPTFISSFNDDSHSSNRKRMHTTPESAKKYVPPPFTLPSPRRVEENKQYKVPRTKTTPTRYSDIGSGHEGSQYRGKRIHRIPRSQIRPKRITFNEDSSPQRQSTSLRMLEDESDLQFVDDLSFAQSVEMQTPDFAKRLSISPRVHASSNLNYDLELPDVSGELLDDISAPNFISYDSSGLPDESRLSMETPPNFSSSLDMSHRNISMETPPSFDSYMDNSISLSQTPRRRTYKREGTDRSDVTPVRRRSPALIHRTPESAKSYVPLPFSVPEIIRFEQRKPYRILTVPDPSAAYQFSPINTQTRPQREQRNIIPRRLQFDQEQFSTPIPEISKLEDESEPEFAASFDQSSLNMDYSEENQERYRKPLRDMRSSLPEQIGSFKMLEDESLPDFASNYDQSTSSYMDRSREIAEINQHQSGQNRRNIQTSPNYNQMLDDETAPDFASSYNESYVGSVDGSHANAVTPINESHRQYRGQISLPNLSPIQMLEDETAPDFSSTYDRSTSFDLNQKHAKSYYNPELPDVSGELLDDISAPKFISYDSSGLPDESRLSMETPPNFSSSLDMSHRNISMETPPSFDSYMDNSISLSKTPRRRTYNREGTVRSDVTPVRRRSPALIHRTPESAKSYVPLPFSVPEIIRFEQRKPYRILTVPDPSAAYQFSPINTQTKPQREQRNIIPRRLQFDQEQFSTPIPEISKLEDESEPEFAASFDQSSLNMDYSEENQERYRKPLRNMRSSLPEQIGSFKMLEDESLPDFASNYDQSTSSYIDRSREIAEINLQLQSGQIRRNLQTSPNYNQMLDDETAPDFASSYNESYVGSVDGSHANAVTPINESHRQYKGQISLSNLSPIQMLEDETAPDFSSTYDRSTSFDLNQKHAKSYYNPELPDASGELLDDISAPNFISYDSSGLPDESRLSMETPPNFTSSLDMSHRNISMETPPSFDSYMDNSISLSKTPRRQTYNREGTVRSDVTPVRRRSPALIHRTPESAKSYVPLPFSVPEIIRFEQRKPYRILTVPDPSAAYQFSPINTQTRPQREQRNIIPRRLQFDQEQFSTPIPELSKLEDESQPEFAASFDQSSLNMDYSKENKERYRKPLRDMRSSLPEQIGSFKMLEDESLPDFASNYDQSTSSYIDRSREIAEINQLQSGQNRRNIQTSPNYNQMLDDETAPDFASSYNESYVGSVDGSHANAVTPINESHRQYRGQISLPNLSPIQMLEDETAPDFSSTYDRSTSLDLNQKNVGQYTRTPSRSPRRRLSLPDQSSLQMLEDETMPTFASSYYGQSYTSPESKAMPRSQLRDNRSSFQLPSQSGVDMLEDETAPDFASSYNQSTSLSNVNQYGDQLSRQILLPDQSSVQMLDDETMPSFGQSYDRFTLSDQSHVDMLEDERALDFASSYEQSTCGNIYCRQDNTGTQMLEDETPPDFDQSSGYPNSSRDNTDGVKNLGGDNRRRISLPKSDYDYRRNFSQLRNSPRQFHYSSLTEERINDITPPSLYMEQSSTIPDGSMIANESPFYHSSFDSSTSRQDTYAEQRRRSSNSSTSPVRFRTPVNNILGRDNISRPRDSINSSRKSETGRRKRNKLSLPQLLETNERLLEDESDPNLVTTLDSTEPFEYSQRSNFIPQSQQISRTPRQMSPGYHWANLPDAFGEQLEDVSDRILSSSTVSYSDQSTPQNMSKSSPRVQGTRGDYYLYRDENYVPFDEANAQSPFHGIDSIHSDDLSSIHTSREYSFFDDFE